MSISLYAVTWDCSNAKSQAQFWSTVLGKPVMEGATEEFAAIGLQDPPELRPHWMFIKAPEGKVAKNRFHPDLITGDLEAEVTRFIDAGAAKKGAFGENGVRWVTLADPEGNEFDVVAESA